MNLSVMRRRLDRLTPKPEKQTFIVFGIVGKTDDEVTGMKCGDVTLMRMPKEASKDLEERMRLAVEGTPFVVAEVLYQNRETVCDLVGLKYNGAEIGGDT